MHIRSLLPLVLAPALAACAGTVELDTDTTLTEESQLVLEEEQTILFVANEMPYDKLISEAELEPALADALMDARAQGIDFASSAQVEEYFTRALGYQAFLCPYYKSMAEYYTIRALQCAYSACYIMSPWYGAQATYYHNLYQTYCED